jgi:hypothetical protein
MEDDNTKKEKKIAKQALENLEPKNSETQKPKTKKKHKLLVISLILVSIFILLPLLIAGWFGFIPGVSNIMGARDPKDLGVVWTEADYQSYLEKTNASFIDISNAPINPNNPDKKIIFTDPKTVENQTFTQEEITAAINSVGWAWMPISNAQVKFTDNTVEISGNLELDNIEKFIGFIGGVGYENQAVNTAADWGRRFVNGAPIYFKADASVSNNSLNLSLQEASIGRFSVPMDIADKVLYTGSTNSINNAQNFSVDSAKFIDGSLSFSGTYPQTVYVLYE